MTKQDKTELDIILQRAGYVLTACSILAVVSVLLMIDNVL